MKKILLLIFIFLALSILALAAISIGSPATDRTGSIPDGYTEVDKNNPANEGGTVNKVEIFAVTGNDMTDVEVGIFYIVSGDNLTTRDSEYIGTVVGGSVQTFDVDLTVEIGDFIGVYWTDGRIEYDATGPVGDWRKSGDQIPCTNTTFAFYSSRCMSIHGYYEAPVGWDHKWNTQSISKWNTKEFSKWDGLE
jgi:hypothetical protein